MDAESAPLGDREAAHTNTQIEMHANAEKIRNLQDFLGASGG